MSCQNILFIDQGDFIGGAELYNQELMNTLVSHNTQKRKLFLLTSGNPEYTKNIDPSITCIHYPLPSLKLSITSIIKFFPAIIFIGKLLKKHNIDLIHSNTVRSHMIASIAAKIGGTPINWILHDMSFPKKLFQYWSTIPQHIFPVSPTIAKHYSLPTNKLLPNSLDLSLFHSRKEITEIQNICMVGRIDHWKGQHIAIEAMSILRKKGYALQLDIWGHLESQDTKSQESINELKGESEKLKENNIKLCGYSTQPIYSLLPRYDLLIHASTEPEPFGRTIIEAMASGVPVIASNIGGPKNTITNNTDGVLHQAGDEQDLANKIEGLISNLAQANTLRNNALKTVEIYDQQTIIDTYISTLS